MLCRWTNVDTDYHLLIEKLKISIIKNVKRKGVKRNGICSNSKEMRKRICRNAITDSADVVIGKQKETEKNWCNQECKLMIEKKRSARVNWSRSSKWNEYEDYNQTRKKATTVLKRKKDW